MMLPMPDGYAGWLLPPNNPDAPASRGGYDRSPYRVPLAEFAAMFGTSPRRRQLLSAFLEYRAELHSIGLVRGFQWVDGSFVENAEMRRGRGPNDVDVVTFFSDYDARNEDEFIQSFIPLADNEAVKERYNLDVYFEYVRPEKWGEVIDAAVYWYSMWSHTREGFWKGFVSLDISPAEDLEAKKFLDGMV